MMLLYMISYDYIIFYVIMAWDDMIWCDVIMNMIWYDMNQKQNQICWAIAGTIPHISNNIEHLWWGLREMTYIPK